MPVRHRRIPRRGPRGPAPAAASIAVAVLLGAAAGSAAADPAAGPGTDPGADPPVGPVAAAAASSDASASGVSASGAPPGIVPERPVGERTLELMLVSGLDDEIRRLSGSLVDALADGFASADDSGSPERLRVAAEAGASAFAAERVHDAVARRIETMLEPEARARLVRHHKSPLGRRALAAEGERGPLAEDPDALERFAAEAARRPGHEARTERFGSLMTETGAAVLVAHLSAELERVALHGALVADPAGTGADFDERVRDLEWQRDIVRFMLSRELPTLLAFTYAELSDEEVDALLEASRDGDQRRLLEALRAGVHDAVLAGTEDFESRYRDGLRRAELSGDEL